MPSSGTQRSRFTHIILVLVAVLAVSIAASPQKPAPWERDWTTWSLEECREILENSPWTKIKPSSLILARNRQQPRYASQWVRAQIRSATPVRAALLRQQLLKRQFEKRSNSERRAVLQDAHEQLSAAYDHIRIRVDYGPSTRWTLPNDTDDFGRTYRSDPITAHVDPDGTGAFLLLPDGTRVDSIGRKQSVHSNYFELTFPRAVNGKEIFVAAPGIVSLRLVRIEKKAECELWRFDFRADEMTYQGKLEY